MTSDSVLNLRSVLDHENGEPLGPTLVQKRQKEGRRGGKKKKKKGRRKKKRKIKLSVEISSTMCPPITFLVPLESSQRGEVH